MRIAFIDMTCPKPYHFDSLKEEAMGGTEATVIRIANALRKDGHEVTLYQHNSGEDLPRKPTHAILLRDPSYCHSLKQAYPDSKLYLWLHDIVNVEVANHWPFIGGTNTTVLTVSDWHKTQATEAFKALGFEGQFRIKRVYNPVDDAVKKVDKEVDKNRLIFTSSPHKGLEHTLKIFNRLKLFNPELKLVVANPGYIDASKEAKELMQQPNVRFLGALKHEQVLEEVSKSFAMLHLNQVFPETFGIVYAEAQALGVPFLTKRMGAVGEISDDDGQFIDVTDVKAIAERLRLWQKYGRPNVDLKSQFRLTNVLYSWYTILNAK